MGPNLIATSARLNAHKKAHKSKAIPVNKSLKMNFFPVRLKFFFFSVTLIELMGWGKCLNNRRFVYFYLFMLA